MTTGPTTSSSEVAAEGPERLWRLVQADHDRIWSLLNFLTGGAGEPQGPAERRRAAALSLVALASAHEVAEEVVVWPAVRRLAEGGQEMAEIATKQEKQAKRAFNEFQHLRPGTEDFTQCLHTLAAMTRSHITYEQSQVWPALSGALSPEEVAALCDRWVSERRLAPTRPHPHTPARPGLLTSWGRLVAQTDRALDIVGRRPSKWH